MLTELLRHPRTDVRVLLLGVTVCLLSGCGTTYLLQATRGEMHVLNQRRPIDKVIADPATPQPLKDRLAEVQAARDFASRELHLPDNRSYRTYADLKQPYVVWNVVAVPEFSVQPKVWCYPIAGCVTYHGYFKEQSARAFAAKLAKRGFDVAIDDVPTYSTLGKFADPVLSTMMRYGDDDLAAMIFHELAHQLLYVKNDSAFNEAFATTVEDVGLDRWLKSQGKPGRKRPTPEENARERERERQYVDLFASTRAKLAKLYASGVSVPEKRAAKAEVFAGLAQGIHDLEQKQGVRFMLYEQWIKEGLNNARLASVATYNDCVPGFERLLKDQDDDLPRFYEAARQLAKLPRAERHAKLCKNPQITAPQQAAAAAAAPGELAPEDADPR
jgi:predicted aminopeptidase